MFTRHIYINSWYYIITCKSLNLKAFTARIAAILEISLS